VVEGVEDGDEAGTRGDNDDGENIFKAKKDTKDTKDTMTDASSKDLQSKTSKDLQCKASTPHSSQNDSEHSDDGASEKMIAPPYTNAGKFDVAKLWKNLFENDLRVPDLEANGNGSGNNANGSHVALKKNNVKPVRNIFRA
jgi:hypothetical protein